MTETDTIEEAARQMNICNACRYCEGHCAVFPAIERRVQFTETDLTALANLCHDCRACFAHCQYAPPHEFAVNVPRVFSDLRARTYAEFAWPRFMAPVFARNGIVVGAATGLALAAALALAFLLIAPAVLWGTHSGPGAFYAVIPHGLMMVAFGAAFLFAVLALALSVRRFWRAIHPDAERPAELWSAFWSAAHDAGRMRNLEGGGPGCTWPGEAPSAARRWCHHLTAYGFLLCFAATTVATLYHYGLRLEAPYGFASLPVILGTLGGIGLVLGPLGFLMMGRAANPELEDDARRAMDHAFLVLLVAVSVTGLALLALRDSAAMGILLVVHLAVVMGLFVILPYGKFVHGFYRFAALMHDALERDRVGEGGDWPSDV